MNPNPQHYPQQGPQYQQQNPTHAPPQYPQNKSHPQNNMQSSHIHMNQPQNFNQSHIPVMRPSNHTAPVPQQNPLQQQQHQQSLNQNPPQQPQHLSQQPQQQQYFTNNGAPNQNHNIPSHNKQQHPQSGTNVMLNASHYIHNHQNTQQSMVNPNNPSPSNPNAPNPHNNPSYNPPTQQPYSAQPAYNHQRQQHKDHTYSVSTPPFSSGKAPNARPDIATPASEFNHMLSFSSSASQHPNTQNQHNPLQNHQNVSYYPTQQQQHPPLTTQHNPQSNPVNSPQSVPVHPSARASPQHPTNQPPSQEIESTLPDFEGPVSYQGDMQGSLFHGRGKLTYINSGVIFDGTFIQGQRNGHGVLYYPGPSKPDPADPSKSITQYIKLEAIFENNRIKGTPTVYYADGDLYLGCLRDGSMHGYGRYYYKKDNDIYIGQFVQGYRHGFGVMKFNIRSSPQNIASGLALNNGALSDCAEAYEGEWYKDQYHGMGKFFGQQGVYVGEYKNGLRHGKGKLTYPNGNVYDGEFKDNQKDGYGVLTYSRGGLYQGQWLKDVATGDGFVEYINGETYKGGFLNGRKHGDGILTLPSGDVLKAQWDNDVPRGRGVIHYSNGATYDGGISNDSREGFGVLHDPTTNTRYEGNFSSNKRHGQGRIVFPDNSFAEGTWINGQLNAPLQYHLVKNSIWNNPDF